MFDKYGEFDSAEEINEAAKAQLEEGDLKAIMEIALENGIDKEDADDYIDGIINILVTPLLGAYGKLDIESEELKPYEIMNDWVAYIRSTCQENPEMAVAVRRSDKSLKGCIAELLKWSLSNAKPVDKDILNACNIKYNVTRGIPGIGTAKKLIREYYLGGGK